MEPGLHVASLAGQLSRGGQARAGAGRVPGGMRWPPAWRRDPGGSWRSRERTSYLYPLVADGRKEGPDRPDGSFIMPDAGARRGSPAGEEAVFPDGRPETTEFLRSRRSV